MRIDPSYSMILAVFTDMALTDAVSIPSYLSLHTQFLGLYK